MESVLFIDYATTVKLLSVTDAMAICEDVFRMHARKSVKWSVPPSQKLDVGAPFHNHWHVKTVILEDEPVAGVRLYTYYDDGLRNTVGRLDCTRYIVISDPVTARPLCILDEHWTYAIRSAAAAMVALKRLGPKAPHTLGLVGVGTMGENCLRCLQHMYRFDEIVCTSRRPETREAFAADPQVYMPRFGGYDPVGIARGVSTPGYPQLWALVNGRLYLFYSVEARAAFIVDPAATIAAAEARWAEVAHDLAE